MTGGSLARFGTGTRMVEDHRLLGCLLNIGIFMIAYGVARILGGDTVFMRAACNAPPVSTVRLPDLVIGIVPVALGAVTAGWMLVLAVGSLARAPWGAGVLVVVCAMVMLLALWSARDVVPVTPCVTARIEQWRGCAGRLLTDLRATGYYSIIRPTLRPASVPAGTDAGGPMVHTQGDASAASEVVSL